MSKQISILGTEFTVTTPYAEGHAVSAAEAKALNQCRAENIANNFRKRVKDADGNAAALAEVTDEFNAYDATYEFTLASAGGSRSSMTPLEKEARKVAKAWISAKLKDAGKSLKVYTEEIGADGVKAKIAEVSEADAIVALAKKNLKEAEKLADTQLEL